MPPRAGDRTSPPVNRVRTRSLPPYIPSMLEAIGSTPWDAALPGHDGGQLCRVLEVDGGIVRVLGAAGLFRAGYGGELLAEVARDSRSAPVAGDWVVVRLWPDRRRTVQRVLPRPVPPAPS